MSNIRKHTYLQRHPSSRGSQPAASRWPPHPSPDATSTGSNSTTAAETRHELSIGKTGQDKTRIRASNDHVIAWPRDNSRCDVYRLLRTQQSQRPDTTVLYKIRQAQHQRAGLCRQITPSSSRHELAGGNVRASNTPGTRCIEEPSMGQL